MPFGISEEGILHYSVHVSASPCIVTSYLGAVVAPAQEPVEAMADTDT